MDNHKRQQTSIRDLLADAKVALHHVTDQPLFDAELLLAFVLNESRVFLHQVPEKNLNDEQIAHYHSLIKRRVDREPIAYIIGKREFWSLSFKVTPHTLIPRPETELLVETILGLYQEKNEIKKIADLGTGTGAIGFALAHERPQWEIHATDICGETLQVAKQNADYLGIEKVSFHQGSWCSVLPCTDFDVIVSNPPYLSETEWPLYCDHLAFEPRVALIAGSEGLEAITEILQSAKRYLKPNGYILIEHGFLQSRAVRELFARWGFNQIRSLRDFNGHDRVTLGQR